MKCAAARRLIVLDAGDLTPAEAAKLSAHLASCETCRQFAASPVNDPSDFRGEMPLSPADFTRIRANVRASLRERGTRGWLLPFRLWAPAATAVLVMAFGWLATRSPSVPVAPPAVPSPAPRQELRPPAAPSPSYAGPGFSPESKPSPSETSRPRVSPSRGRTLEKSSAVPDAAPAGAIEAGNAQVSPRPLLIEIHTADPDVRILWIAQQAPAEPNPTTSMEE